MNAPAIAHRTCAHCGLAIPAGRGDEFCCGGCAIVHAAIVEHGLESYYQLRDVATPARTTGRSYAELDDDAFARVHVQTSQGIARTAFYLEDLRCTACVWLVENAPRCVPGLLEVRLDLGRARADVVWDPDACQLSTIARHLDRIGHAVHPYRGLDRDRQRRREDRKLLVRIGVAGAAMGNLMLLAIALYAGLFEGMASADATFFRWASMLVAVPALGFAATPMFRTAIGALRARRLHLDLPLSIGIAVGLGWGSANVIRGVGEIYFDSLAMLVFLLLVARWIVLRHQRRASTASELLIALTPSRARRLDPATGAITEVPIDALVPDDVVTVLVGETIPVDGIVTRGVSAIDVGLLTGESRPVDVAFGARVHAGTVNVAAPLEIVVTAIGEATRVGVLVATIEALGTRRAPIERLVDRIAGRFVAIVTIAAALTFLGWSMFSVALGAEHAMALLVVTCPCALALATPLAVTVALGRAARKGVLIKGADALERMATPGVMFVDKTGTLTAGELAVVTWRGDLDAAELAAAIEAGSNHPVARAFGRHATPVATARDIREELGRGISGWVGARRVFVGAPSWIGQHCHASPTIAAWIAEVAGRGEALGIPASRCLGGVTPEGKTSTVARARALCPVVMVGDGVNDAAAMVAATTSIAVSGSAEIAVEVADVYLRSPSIRAIAWVAAGARATLTTIRRNLRFSLAYNLLAGTLAVTGLIHPLVAAAVMPLSSLTVLASSLRSRAFRGVT